MPAAAGYDGRSETHFAAAPELFDGSLEISGEKFGCAVVLVERVGGHVFDGSGAADNRKWTIRSGSSSFICSSGQLSPISSA